MQCEDVILQFFLRGSSFSLKIGDFSSLEDT